MKTYGSIIEISEEQVLQMEMNNNSIAGAITFDVPLAGIRQLRLIVIDCHLWLWQLHNPCSQFRLFEN